MEAKDLKLYDVRNAKPLKKFDQVFLGSLVSWWYAEWIGRVKD